MPLNKTEWYRKGKTKMKKGILIALLSALTTFVITATVCKTNATDIKNLYPRTGIITEIDYNADKVNVKCANGNEYHFYGTEDYEVGDIVSLIVKQNSTEVVTDDTVVSHRYDGFVELLEK